MQQLLREAGTNCDKCDQCKVGSHFHENTDKTGKRKMKHQNWKTKHQELENEAPKTRRGNTKT